MADPGKSAADLVWRIGGYAARQAVGLAVPLTFLKFSRGFEREADLLGLQYMYKAGYDPTAFVDFFERMEAMEKKKPGTVSELFRSHPKMAARIQYTQKNVQDLLAAQPQYVINTSEFLGREARPDDHVECAQSDSREIGAHPAAACRVAGQRSKRAPTASLMRKSVPL